MFPKLQIENQAAIKLEQNPEYHQSTKPNRIRHFFVRELVTFQEIEEYYFYQFADIVKKALHRPRKISLYHSMDLCQKIKIFVKYFYLKNYLKMESIGVLAQKYFF